jgi:hypothetical protein
MTTNKKLTPSLLYSSASSKTITPVLKVSPEETLVIKWE